MLICENRHWVYPTVVRSFLGLDIRHWVIVLLSQGLACFQFLLSTLNYPSIVSDRLGYKHVILTAMFTNHQKTLCDEVIQLGSGSMFPCLLDLLLHSAKYNG